MILADTSVWIDHLRHANPRLAAALEAGEIACHPMVRGDLALGRLTHRRNLLALLEALPRAIEATHDEVLHVVEVHTLDGAGIGWVDAHLLTSVLLGAMSLWTLDRRLAALARRLGVGA